MVQIETAPVGRSRHAATRAGSGRPQLVLVISRPSEPGAPAGPTVPADTDPIAAPEPTRRAVLRGRVRAGQLLPAPSAPVRVPPAARPRSVPAAVRVPAPVRPPAVWSKAAPARPNPRPVRAPIRLTTRGRVVVVALLLAPLLVVLSLLFRAQVDAISDATAPRAYPTVVVQPGDTLWTIANRIAPDRDPRAVIYQIREINGLAGAEIQVGQRLAVPPG